MNRLSDSRLTAGFAGKITQAALFGAAFPLSFWLSCDCLRAQQQPAGFPAEQSSQQSAASISREVKDVFSHAAKAVVKVHGVDEHSDIYGTGFFIDPTGTLYTSYSVGGEAGNFTIDFGGKQYPARLVLAD